MNKKVYLFAAVAALFAACSNNDGAESAEKAQAQQNAQQIAVGFDAYQGRALTRAGATALLDLTSLQTNGFGVFAYYTNNTSYDDTSIPNFMYNQKIEYDSEWKYEPVKYWPNEYGNTAVADETDKLTFFAYAPYVQVVPSTGKLTAAADEQTWGITGLTKNTAAGDPMVKYIVNFNASKSVDLCWGTFADETAYTSWAKVNGGSNQTLTAGLPWLDVERPADATGTGTSAQKVKFDFKHATSKLNVQIAYYADKQDNSSSAVIDGDKTKIYVRSITFTGFATKGALNLNNTTKDEALWMSYNGNDDLESGESVTIYDGRKDGKEGVDGAVATNEKITGLNSSIISDDANTQGGVTNDLKNLFTGAEASTPIYVIPTGETITVEIVYDVETKDDNLSGYLSDGKTHGSTIENRIKKSITFGTGADKAKFVNGKAYTLKLYLGMNSVKFDADVTGWVNADEGSGDLPANQN